MTFADVDDKQTFRGLDLFKMQNDRYLETQQHASRSNFTMVIVRGLGTTAALQLSDAFVILHTLARPLPFPPEHDRRDKTSFIVDLVMTFSHKGSTVCSLLFGIGTGFCSWFSCLTDCIVPGYA